MGEGKPRAAAQRTAARWPKAPPAPPEGPSRSALVRKPPSPTGTGRFSHVALREVSPKWLRRFGESAPAFRRWRWHAAWAPGPAKAGPDTSLREKYFSRRTRRREKDKVLSAGGGNQEGTSVPSWNFPGTRDGRRGPPVGCSLLSVMPAVRLAARRLCRRKGRGGGRTGDGGRGPPVGCLLLAAAAAIRLVAGRLWRWERFGGWNGIGFPFFVDGPKFPKKPWKIFFVSVAWKRAKTGRNEPVSLGGQFGREDLRWTLLARFLGREPCRRSPPPAAGNGYFSHFFHPFFRRRFSDSRPPPVGGENLKC